MKNFFISFLLFLSVNFNLWSQKAKTDSLIALLPKSKTLTERIDLMLKLSIVETDYKVSMKYATEGLHLSERINYKKGEASAFYLLGFNQSLIGNNSKALDYYLKALQQYEAINNPVKIAECLQNISSVYDDMTDYEKALEYSMKGYRLAKSIHSIVNTCLFAWNNGFYLCELNQPKKALPYFSESYSLSKQIKDFNYTGRAYMGFGIVNTQTGQLNLALLNFKKGERELIKANDGIYLMYNYQVMAELYEKKSQKDSSIIYFEKALRIASKIDYVKIKEDCYRGLANLYANSNPSKAVTYFQQEAKLRDSLYNFRKKSDIQLLTLNEEERQEEIIKKQQEETEMRRQNIQYALIALAFVTLVILTLIFSKGVIKSTRIIQFLGIIALLILFEFINLLIHPFLEKITHHSPILMLLGLVSIAFLIVPLHHKLEHWAVEKLIERHKISREKAMQELDSNNELDINPES